MIPKQLHSASRQYRHNNKEGFVRGFDWEETIKAFRDLEDKLKVSQWIQDEQQKVLLSLDEEITRLQDEQ